MTIKEVNKMRMEGFENYQGEQLLDAYSVTNATKNTLATLEKEIKDAMEKSMKVGDQLSLNFGNDTITSRMVSTEELSFDISDDDLYVECSKVASAYCKTAVDKAAIKKDFVKGVLHPDLCKHVVITQQQEMKISKKARKDVM